MLSKQQYDHGCNIFYSINNDKGKLGSLIWEWKVYYKRVNIEEPTINQLIDFIITVKKW